MSPLMSREIADRKLRKITFLRSRQQALELPQTGEIGGEMILDVRDVEFDADVLAGYAICLRKLLVRGHTPMLLECAEDVGFVVQKW